MADSADDPSPNPHDEIKQPDKPKLLQVLGPGLITGASDDDPSGIATYSQAGAQFGFGLSWVMLFSWPLMCAIQEISARIGRVTGRGIAGNLKRHYPAPVVYSIVALLVVANVINIGADLGAMGAALKLLIGGPALVYVALFGLVTVLLEVFSRYSRYVSILKWLTLSLFAYVGVAFVVKMPWGAVAKSLVIPEITFTPAYMTVVVAILGTTISPYLFFWQAEEEVEEVRERADQAKPLERDRRRRPSSGASSRIRIDTYVGMAFSNLVALFIILTTAATLHAHGITDIQTSRPRRRAGAAPGRRTVRPSPSSVPSASSAPACWPCRFWPALGGLCGGRGVWLARGPGACKPYAGAQGLLRHHRHRHDHRRGAELHADRSDQGAVLERGDQRRGRRAGDGSDDAPLQPTRPPWATSSWSRMAERSIGWLATPGHGGSGGGRSSRPGGK